MSNVHSDLDTVVDAELALLTAEVRHDRVSVGALLADDFREVGTSGRVWDRASTMDALAVEEGRDVEAHDVVAERLADGVVLVTYATSEAGARALRSSVWVRDSDGAWRLRHHQGTPAPEETTRRPGAAPTDG